VITMNLFGLKATKTSLEDNANLGCCQAQYQLAKLLIGDDGETLNIVKWLRRAAVQKHAKAMLMLGRWYLGHFNSVSHQQSIDTLQSRYWFKKSLKLGLVVAWECLGDTYKAEGQMDLAVEHYKKAASFDNTEAMFKVGQCYQLMEPESIHYRHEYLQWITLAAELGNAQAQYHLAMYFKKVSVCTQHIAQYESWLRASGFQGFNQAIEALADLYYDGYMSIKQDYHKSLTWTLQLAQQGNKQAYERIANIYRNGLGINKNLAKAEKYANEALWLR
jgi:uncharacterized protein